MDKHCYCGSRLLYDECCGPLINFQKPAASPEALMRSRYSAYASQAYQYILDTYAQAPRETLSKASLSTHNRDTRWLNLEVLTCKADTVEFKAYYQVDKQVYCMHEISTFVIEDGAWRYLSGDMLAGTAKLDVGRNSPCPCGSGKKYKRCCS